MDVIAACAHAQCARAPLNVSAFYGWLQCPLFQVVAMTTGMLVPGIGSADAGRCVSVCEWGSGCVRIDPLQDRTAFY